MARTISSEVLTRNGHSKIGLTRYTEQQANAINQQRMAFNRHEEDLAVRLGINSWGGNDLIGNAGTVPKDAWGQWSEGGIAIRRSMLGVFEDISSATSRPVDYGVIVDHFAQYSDNSTDVHTSIDGRGDGQSDQVTITYQGTPIAVKTNNCVIGARQMATMMRSGQAGTLMLDQQMLNKNRHILESLEDMTLNGLTDDKGNLIDVGGAKAYGLLNHPQRNTFTHGIVINGATAKEIKDAVKGTLKAAHDDNYKTGFTLYFNWDDYFYMSSEQDALAAAEGTPTATGAIRKTIYQELLNLPGVDRIVATDSIPVNTIIALVRDREVVEVLNGMPLTQAAQFRANPTDDYVFKNMAAQAVQLKFDANGQMGLAVGTQV